VDSHSVWYTITIPALAYFQAAAVSQIPTNNITVYPYIIPNGAGVTLTNLVPLANGSLLASNTVVYLAVCGDQTEFNLFATNTVPPANDMVSNALILQNSAPAQQPIMSTTPSPPPPTRSMRRFPGPTTPFGGRWTLKCLGH